MECSATHENYQKFFISVTTSAYTITYIFIVFIANSDILRREDKLSHLLM
jgi:hypothetical protein